MTTIKQKKQGNYYTELRAVARYGFGYYEVILYWYGIPINQNVYRIEEIDKARKCFYRYNAKAKARNQAERGKQ